MVTTFFLGNGLDVGFGLKSRYTDFYEYFKLKCDGCGNGKYKKFCTDLMELKPESEHDFEYKWSDFEHFMGEYAANFNSRTKWDFIDFLDFFSGTFMRYLEERSDRLINGYQNLGVKIEKGLLWFDSADEDKCVKFSKGFTEAMERTRNTFLEKGEFVNIISFNYTEIVEDILSMKSEKDTKRGDGQASHEYTNHHDIDCSGRYARINYLGHIHGSVKHDPIMGVNDSEQIKGRLRKDKEFGGYVVKSELMDVNRNISPKVIEDTINESNVICVYGCSLGETDKKWWNLILKKLKADCNSQLVVFLHDRSVINATKNMCITETEAVQNLMRCLVEDKKEEILLKFDGYTASEKSNERIDVDALRKRIHVALNHDIFALGYTYGPETPEPMSEAQFEAYIREEENAK